MTPETEGKLLRSLGGVELAQGRNGEQIASIGKAVGKLADTVDKIRDGLTEFRVQLERQNGRLQNVERRVVELEESVDESSVITGRHELQRLQDKLKNTEVKLATRVEHKTRWALWAAGTAVTAAVGAAGYMIRLLLGG